MPKFIAISEFQHDGHPVMPGQEIDLSDNLAKYLLEGGAIKPIADKPAVKKEK